jgi:hypothetical protein
MRLCALAGFVVCSLAVAAPVAMVSDLKGKASLVAGGAHTPLVMLAEIEPNAQVEVDAGASLVALYLDGSGEYAVTGPALVAFGAQQPRAVKGAAPQKRTVLGGKAGSEVRLKSVGAAQGALVMRSVTPRGRIRLVNPAGARTLESSPEFRWQFDAKNATYRFELIDEAGAVIHEADVTGNSLKLPAAVKLKENAPYTWTVSTRAADGRKYSATSEFSVAPASLRQQVSAVQPQGNASVSDRVAYAAWLEQLELKDEARKVWRSLAAERPDESRLGALARE